MTFATWFWLLWGVAALGVELFYLWRNPRGTLTVQSRGGLLTWSWARVSLAALMLWAFYHLFFDDNGTLDSVLDGVFIAVGGWLGWMTRPVKGRWRPGRKETPYGTL